MSGPRNRDPPRCIQIMRMLRESGVRSRKSGDSRRASPPPGSVSGLSLEGTPADTGVHAPRPTMTAQHDANRPALARVPGGRIAASAVGLVGLALLGRQLGRAAATVRRMGRWAGVLGPGGVHRRLRRDDGRVHPRRGDDAGGRRGLRAAQGHRLCPDRRDARLGGRFSHLPSPGARGDSGTGRRERAIRRHRPGRRRAGFQDGAADATVAGLPVQPAELLAGVDHCSLHRLRPRLDRHAPRDTALCLLRRLAGDVARAGRGTAVERGPAYYAVLVLGLLATIAVSTLVTRAARQALREAGGEDEL